jgi:hypothetical protein
MSSKKKGKVNFEKKEILELLKKKPHPPLSNIAKKCNVTASAICQLSQNRDKWGKEIASSTNLECTKERKSTIPTLENTLLNFFLECRKKKVEISTSLLREKALSVAADLVENDSNLNENERKLLQEFKASNGFIEKFLRETWN